MTPFLVRNGRTMTPFPEGMRKGLSITPQKKICILRLDLSIDRRKDSRVEKERVASKGGRDSLNRFTRIFCLSSLYIFLDEAGNLDFAPSGTKFFCLSSVSCVRPFDWDATLREVKCDLLEFDLNIYRFHASEDRQRVRDKVFEVICSHISNLRIDSLIVEKNKTQPHLRNIEKFYPKMMGYLVAHIWSQVKDSEYEKIVFITDSIPVKKRRDIVEKTIKQTLAEVLPKGIRHSIYHHPSQSCLSLQVADYCNWAIFRKWEREDKRSYELIKKGIKSEFDIFRKGIKLY